MLQLQGLPSHEFSEQMLTFDYFTYVHSQVHMFVCLYTFSAFPASKMKTKSSEQEKQLPEAGKCVSMAHGCI